MLKLTGLTWTSARALRSHLVKKEYEVVYTNLRVNICRTMVSKPYRIKKKKPAPFPYEEGKYNYMWGMIDLTKARFDENTKLIVVEGPIHSDKNEVAKKIADAFEMRYVPAPTMDHIYINAYGYDMRELDNALPLPVQSYDEKNFNLDPTHFNAAAFQLHMYRLRYNWHIDACAHILNTGQGVVTVRSPFSDFIWTESMFQSGYLSPNVTRYYYEVVRHSLSNLFRPHLVVYLDVPVKETIENIKTKGKDYEINSKALTPEFIQTMETLYKERYLAEANVPSEVLVVDRLEDDDCDTIIDDIERIDFDSERNSRDPKFSDWLQDEWWLDWMRLHYTSVEFKNRLVYQMNVETYDCPELFADDEAWKVYDRVMKKAPGNEYSPGFNIKRGEKSVLWRDLRSRRVHPEN